MPTIEQNRTVFTDYDWSREGNEWSDNWGETEVLWTADLWPRIRAQVPARNVLEIAPGYGRFTHYLKDLCDRLVIVDLLDVCIDACKERFADEKHIEYWVNDGKSLSFVDDRSIDFAFSFDSLVHVERDVITAYITELGRLLADEGRAFLHHSNLAALSDEDGNLPFENKHWRAATVSADLVRELADANGLSCVRQELVTWDQPFLTDCFTLLTRKGSGTDWPQERRENHAFAQNAQRLRDMDEFWREPAADRQHRPLVVVDALRGGESRDTTDAPVDTPPPSESEATNAPAVVSTTATVDRTRDFDYDRLIEEEKEHYSTIEVTETLHEGGVHARSSWEYYWQRVALTIDRSPFHDLASWLEVDSLRRNLGRPIRILSLGSGYCGPELALARALSVPYEVRCTDINPDLFTQAREQAEADGLSLDFAEADLNFMTIEPGHWDLIFAHASIHHVINLEQLFDQIRGGLSTHGIFHLVEVVGQNRKLIWDENERYANRLLDLLPAELTGDQRLAVPEEVDGMEGVRQEDILPLLRERFTARFEHRHGAFMRFVCTHIHAGEALDPGNPETLAWLDMLIDADQSAVQRGVLEPLEIWGVYKA
ncbi:MAG: class I SAM-dependent methyltransferase, partial [Acidobacteriota bacterium]